MTRRTSRIVRTAAAVATAVAAQGRPATTAAAAPPPPTPLGVSNVGGRERLGYDVGGLPYYFALPGQPSTVPSNTGYSFEHLVPGYYATTEEYTAMGRTWQASNRVAGTELVGCQV